MRQRRKEGFKEQGREEDEGRGRTQRRKRIRNAGRRKLMKE